MELSPPLIQGDNFDPCIHLAYTSKVLFSFFKFVTSQMLSIKWDGRNIIRASLFKIKFMYDKVHTLVPALKCFLCETKSPTYVHLVLPGIAYNNRGTDHLKHDHNTT